MSPRSARSAAIGLALGAVALATANARPAAASDLIVNSTYTISADTTFTNVVVQQGGTLTVDAVLTVTDDMTVQAGGVVTHTVRYQPGLRLVVQDSLVVQVGGAVDVTAKGLRGGRNGVFGLRGEAYDPVTFEIVAGASYDSGYGAGASHGGPGSPSTGVAGEPNPPYGLVEWPQLLGAGGASEAFSPKHGGDGGGRITIEAATLVVEGSIRATGGEGFVNFSQSGDPGGGAGGSILVEVSALSGAGTIKADGGTARGNGTDFAGTGGGGRIALYFETSTFPPANISAAAGAHAYASQPNQGGAGTIYLRDADDPGATLIIDNRGRTTVLATPPLTAETGFSTLVVRGAANFEAPGVTADTLWVDGGIYTLRDSLTASDPGEFVLSAGGRVTIVSGVTVELPVFDPAINILAGTMNLDAGARLDVLSNSVHVGPQVTLCKDGAFGIDDRIGSMRIEGIVCHGSRNLNGLLLDVATTLQIDATGAVDVSDRGLLGGLRGAFGREGEAYDPDTLDIVAGANAGTSLFGAGASYGGWGSSSIDSVSSPNRPYGTIEHPVLLGSGGASPSVDEARGGNGGGRVTILAPSLILDGAIRANGGAGEAFRPSVSSPYRMSGGGSGGSIFVDVSSLSGNGTIQSNGAGVAFSNITPLIEAGTGSGGRIAIFFDSSTLPEANVVAACGKNPSSNSGSTAYPGSAGTIYLRNKAEPAGRLILDNANTTTSLDTPVLTNEFEFASILVRGRARLARGTEGVPILRVAGPIQLTGGTYFTLADGDELSSTNASGPDLVIGLDSVFDLDAGAVFGVDAVAIDRGTWNLGQSWTAASTSDLTVSGSSTTTPPRGNVNIEPGSILTVPTFDATNFVSGTVNIPAFARLDVLSDEIVIGQNLLMVKDGTWGPNDDIGTLRVRGVLRHSDRHEPGLDVTARTLIEVQAGGAIDVSWRGLRGGLAGAFGRSGEAYDPVTLQIVAGASPGTSAAGAGASHGGWAAPAIEVGAVPNLPYGTIENPVLLGAGGAAKGTGTALGGEGGGRVTLRAPSLVVNGAIRASGRNGSSFGGGATGGGAGGSILVEGSSISGTGTIVAVGGNSSAGSSSGSGGRIALYFDDFTFPEANVSAVGGLEFYSLTSFESAAGTIYLRDNGDPTGRLIVRNGNRVPRAETPLLTTLTDLRSISIERAARLAIGSATDSDSIVVDEALEIGSGVQLRLEKGSTVISPRDPASGQISVVGGTLVSSGQFIGDLNNVGTMRVGDVGSSKTVVGGFLQPSAGILELEIGGYDPSDQEKVVVTGTAQLAGTLQVAFVDGFTPSEGDAFTLMEYGAHTGSFTTLSLPELGGGLRWNLVYGATSLVAEAQGFFNAIALDLSGPNLVDVDVASGFTRVIGPLTGSIGPLFASAQASSAPGRLQQYLLTEPGTGTSRLIALDLATNSVTTNVQIAADVSGIAVDPFDERIFTGLGFGGPHSHLARILPDNGYVLDLGPLNFAPSFPDAAVEILAFSPAGELYALQNTVDAPRLWSIDLRTRTASLRGIIYNGHAGIDDATFLGDELWVMRSADGMLARIDVATGATTTTSTLLSPGPLGLAPRPCAVPSAQLVAGDNPLDGGGAIRLNWTGFPAPPNLVRYDIYRAQDPCTLTSATTTPVGTVNAGAPQVFVDPIGTDYDLQFYRIDVVVSVAKRVADQLNQQLFSGPVAAAPNVLINEFEPAAGQAKRVGERVELRNLSADPIDLTGFRLSDGVVEETLSGVIAGDGYLVYTLLVIELLAEGGTLDLLPPTGSAFVVDSVSYGSEGGAPSVPAGFTISRVEGTDSDATDVTSFSISSETFGSSNLVAAPDLGSSLVFNEIHHAGSAATDYFEIFNPLGSTIALDAFAVSSGSAFVDTLSAGLVLRSGALGLIGPGGLAPFDRDLTSTQLYLYRITADGLLQLVDQVGWGPALGDAMPPSAIAPNDAVVRAPDGAATYLGDAGTNWIDCGGDVTLFYGPQTPGMPNIVPGVVSYVVDPSGEGDYTTIGAALAGAATGSVIYLEPGIYEETVDLVAGVSLVGRSTESEPVILQGDGSNPAVIADLAEATARLSNVTIASAGGGLLVNAGFLTLERVHFRDNEGQHGAAVRVEGGAPSFVGCVFERNVARADGGAVALLSGSASFTSCVFVRNEARGRGGVLYAATGTSAQIEHCILDRNATSGAGAALHANGGKIDVRYSAVVSSTAGAALASQGGELDFGCGVLHDNAAAITMTSGLTMANVSTEDPQFCQPLALNYAYATTSPLVALAASCGSTIGTDAGPCGPVVTSTPPRIGGTEHVLHPAVPNPFNPLTELRFELASAGSVRLDVYDTRGRLVRSLVENRTLDQGAHAVTWNGVDRLGRSTASGVYFARLRVDGRDVGSVRRLVLLK